MSLVEHPHSGVGAVYRGRLFRKYFALVLSLVCGALLASGLIGVYFSHRENSAALAALQREKALAAASTIETFIRQIEQQLAFAALPQLGSESIEMRRIEFYRLLRLAPSVTDITHLDGKGREQLAVSRLVIDVAASGTDHSHDPAFRGAQAGRTWFGPVYFRRETEPYMAMAVRSGGASGPVTVAHVNLKFVWDVVTRIKIGEKGKAYVVDNAGRLIADPDISLVLRKTDFSALAQVQAALVSPPHEASAMFAFDPYETEVLSASVGIEPLGWRVFVEQPVSEVYATLNASILRTGGLLLLGLVISALAAFVFARGMVRPIRTLQEGAQRVGAGDLEQRIEVRTGDELEALADQFNRMSRQLRESYAGLEQKVSERTQQLREAFNSLEEKNVALDRARRDAESASRAKTHFLASASHDLRQPIHTLSLFSAALAMRPLDKVSRDIAQHMDTALQVLTSQFDALLDISKLDAGVVRVDRSPIKLRDALERIRSELEPAARKKGLDIVIDCPRDSAIESDQMLFDRIVRNLLDNAVKYTDAGRIDLHVARNGSEFVLAVADTGCGIPRSEHARVFDEFYQLHNPERDRTKGLGLGLAIVRRLTNLLQIQMEMKSSPGKGTAFYLSLPAMQPAVGVTAKLAEADPTLGVLHVLVVDDEEGSRLAMKTLLEGFGCHVTLVDGTEQALDAVQEERPDIVLSDLRLRGKDNGIETIRAVRRRYPRMPAILISGDIAPHRLRKAERTGIPLLHKPVQVQVLKQAIARAGEKGRRA